MTTICLFWEITPWHTRKHSSNSKKKKMIPTINSALCATYRHTHTLSSTSSLHPSESIHTKTQTRHLVVVFFFFYSCLFQRFAKQRNSTQELQLFWKHGTPNAAVSSTTTSNEDARQEISLLLLSSSCMNG